MNPNGPYGVPPNTFGGPPKLGPPPTSMGYSHNAPPSNQSSLNPNSDGNKNPGAPMSYNTGNVNVFKPPSTSFPAPPPPPATQSNMFAPAFSGTQSHAPPSTYHPPQAQYGPPPVGPPPSAGVHHQMMPAGPPPPSNRGSYTAHAPAPLNPSAGMFLQLLSSIP